MSYSQISLGLLLSMLALAMNSSGGDCDPEGANVMEGDCGASYYSVAAVRSADCEAGLISGFEDLKGKRFRLSIFLLSLIHHLFTCMNSRFSGLLSCSDNMCTVFAF